MQMHYVDKERVETCPIETPPPPNLQLTANFRYYTMQVVFNIIFDQCCDNVLDVQTV